MSEPTLWWMAAAIAVAVELATGTFYLLMLSIGLAAGALAAHSGAALPVQFVVAALVGGGAVAVWHVVRGKRHKQPPAEANRDVNLDIGETVQVDGWKPDGTAVVKYRGANWTVADAGTPPHLPGPHRVREVVGSRLVVEKI